MTTLELLSYEIMDVSYIKPVVYIMDIYRFSYNETYAYFLGKVQDKFLSITTTGNYFSIVNDPYIDNINDPRGRLSLETHLEDQI